MPLVHQLTSKLADKLASKLSYKPPRPGVGQPQDNPVYVPHACPAARPWGGRCAASGSAASSTTSRSRRPGGVLSRKAGAALVGPDAVSRWAPTRMGHRARVRRFPQSLAAALAGAPARRNAGLARLQSPGGYLAVGGARRFPSMAQASMA
jgi:hypothetical protein